MQSVCVLMLLQFGCGILELCFACGRCGYDKTWGRHVPYDVGPLTSATPCHWLRKCLQTWVKDTGGIALTSVLYKKVSDCVALHT